MKTITKKYKVYTIDELEKKYPESYQKAYKEYQEYVNEDDYYSNEIFESLMSLYRHAGITVKDYSLSMESYRNKIKLSIPCYYPYYNDYNQPVNDLTGQRAYAWLENNLYSQLRIPYGLKKITDYEKKNKRRFYKPGMIPDCPFTGICYDDDFIDDLNKSILQDHMTLLDSFVGLSDTYSRLVEQEYDYRMNEETFKEDCEMNERVFLSSGKEFYL